MTVISTVTYPLTLSLSINLLHVSSLVGVTDLKQTLRNLSALMNELLREEEVAMHAAAQSSMGKLLRLGASEKYESPLGNDNTLFAHS